MKSIKGGCILFSLRFSKSTNQKINVFYLNNKESIFEKKTLRNFHRRLEVSLGFLFKNTKCFDQTARLSEEQGAGNEDSVDTSGSAGLFADNLFHFCLHYTTYACMDSRGTRRNRVWLRNIRGMYYGGFGLY